MSNKVVRFVDYISMPAAQSLFTDARQLLEDLHGVQTITPQLNISIQATHSGYLLNGRVYPGTGVRDGAGSWLSTKNGGTSGYNKPILMHHDSGQDAIGRVTSQQFIKLWNEDKFNNDWRHPDQGTNPGSGFILLGGKIADKEAQTKILDGRYKSVSTGQSSDKMACSICGEDWSGLGFWDEDPCEHKPGKTYTVDKQRYLAYLVTGKLQYMECSFVNHPANELAGVIDTSGSVTTVGENKDGHPELQAFDQLGSVHSLKLTDDKGGVTELLRKEGESDEIPYGDGNAKKGILISVPKGVNLKPKRKTASEDNVPDRSDKTSSENDSAASTSDADTDMTDEEFALANIAQSMQNAGVLSDKELNTCELTFDHCIELIGQLKDADLSAEQRKKLKSKAFCGPNRSFPVPDCAHATAAKRLVDRMKASKSTKSKLLASISRKEKAMDCNSSKDSLSRKAKSAMGKPADDAKTNDAKSEETPEDKTLQVMQTALEDAQAKTAELETELAKSKQLYDAKVNEYNLLIDENAELLSDYQKQLASQLIQVQMQLSKPTVHGVKDASSFEEAVQKLSGRTIDSLRDSIADVIPELSDSFKKNGLPSFIQDRQEPKPATQKSVKPEGDKKPKKKATEESVDDIL